MNLPTPNGKVALVTLTAAAATAALTLSAGGITAANAAPEPAPAADPNSAAADPSVTPLAAALIPGPIDIDRNGRSNVVTARIDFATGESTGWHSHAGQVLVQVASGALTLRHADNGRCVTEVVRAGHGFFETAGEVHLAKNRRSEPAVVYATFVLPVGAPPDVSAPAPVACR